MAPTQQSVTPPDICQCGRLASKPHCPTCGSMQVLASARRKDYITRPDGSVAELTTFRCRVCGLRFNDDDWQIRCTASPPRELVARKGANVLDRVPRGQAALTGPNPVHFDSLDEAPEDMAEHVKSLRKRMGLE